MSELKRNFTRGRMNKAVDERLIPDGEYVDALNIRVNSSEADSIGVVENAMGNEKITTLRYSGSQLSESATCLGVYEDGANDTLYWFVHDPSNEASPTGKIDLIVSLNTRTDVLKYHIVSINDGGGDDTTLNFNPNNLINDIDKIGDLLFFVQKGRPPMRINVKSKYGEPVSDVDGFVLDEVLVIKKPPVASPTIDAYTSSSKDNFLKEKFVSFAYRYKYKDGEYSAISQFTDVAFSPNQFNFDPDSFLNEGMVNTFNAVKITYNTGSDQVVGVDILFKEISSNVIKVVEKINKVELGLADNTEYDYVFDNSKIFTVLPDSQLFRLYDNVPRYAETQTIMGNRLVYGNYTEGYDMVDLNGNSTKIEYQTKVISEEVGVNEVDSYSFGANYEIDGSVSTEKGRLAFDLEGLNLIEGAYLSFDFSFQHDSFSGGTLIDRNELKYITFGFRLIRDYSSAHDLATSPEFIAAIGGEARPVAESCDGATMTDKFNCILDASLDTYSKYKSGISNIDEPIGITTSTGSSVIMLQLPAMQYVDNPSAPSFRVHEYYEILYSDVVFQETGDIQSLHSNRDYEIGIVYMDEYGRSSTALVSKHNNEHIPCSLSDKRNYIQVSIPAVQVAPYWATRYKFVIKSDKDSYNSIYSNIFFRDPLSGDSYFLLDGENSSKIERGDRLIVKTDSNGDLDACAYTTVLEKEAKEADFLSIPSEIGDGDIPIPAGTYMKLRANNFSISQDELAVINNGRKEACRDTEGTYPKVDYPMNIDKGDGTFEDYDVPAGSRIEFEFEFERKGTGSGNKLCERRKYNLKKTMIASQDYSNMLDWWNGDNVEQVLNSGEMEVGGDGCDVENEYIPEVATVKEIGNTDLCTNYYQFYRGASSGAGDDGELVLMVGGTLRCNGITYPSKRRSCVRAEVTVYRANTTMSFESEPTDALSDVWFESSQSFEIDALGQHSGNVLDQDILNNLPAIINTSFFNCFSFGNGVESMKIRDSLVGKPLTLGNRVTTVSAQDFKEAHRFADLTYSGVFNDETNVNKLNEFNLGLLNFKPLEDSFGAIKVIHARQTDILVLQEDKISYVLAGKNLLSDAAAGGAITSIPEVLGTQIARMEEFGISNNPESFTVFGSHKYFTDLERGVVIHLNGSAYSNETIEIISDANMTNWFRDGFIEAPNTFKLGGYDPYMREYVLTSNDVEKEFEEECVPCGTTQTLILEANETKTYCVNIGQLVGDISFRWRVVEVGNADFRINVASTSHSATSGWTSVSGSSTLQKTVVDEEQATVEVITGSEGATLEVSIGCPQAEEITIFEVTINSSNRGGQFIHNEYRWTDGTFISPLHSSSVPLISSTAVPIVSQYNMVTGLQGAGVIPADGADVRMACNKFGDDDFIFNPTQHKLRYLRSDTLYENNDTDIQALITASNNIATIDESLAPDQYSGLFTMPSTGQYLYLIWDYRDSNPLSLCYDVADTSIACCDCIETPETGLSVDEFYSEDWFFITTIENPPLPEDEYYDIIQCVITHVDEGDANDGYYMYPFSWTSFNNEYPSKVVNLNDMIYGSTMTALENEIKTYVEDAYSDLVEGGGTITVEIVRKSKHIDRDPIPYTFLKL